MAVSTRSQHSVSFTEGSSHRKVPAKWIRSPEELLSTMNTVVGKDNVRVEVSVATNIFDFGASLSKRKLQHNTYTIRAPRNADGDLDRALHIYFSQMTATGWEDLNGLSEELERVDSSQHMEGDCCTKEGTLSHFLDRLYHICRMSKTTSCIPRVSSTEPERQEQS